MGAEVLIQAQLSRACFLILSTPALGQLQAGAVLSGRSQVSSPSDFLAFFVRCLGVAEV